MIERLQLLLAVMIILIVAWPASRLGELWRGLKQGMAEFHNDPRYRH